MIKTFIIILAVATALSFSGCTSADSEGSDAGTNINSDGDDTGSTTNRSKILLNFADVSSASLAFRSRQASVLRRGESETFSKLGHYGNVDVNDSDFDAGFELASVTSSKPDEFHLTVTRLSLDGTELFHDDEGKDLIIRDGAVDISYLFDTCINKVTGDNIACDQCYLPTTGEEVALCDTCYDINTTEVECNATTTMSIKSPKAQLSVENRDYSDLQIEFKTKAKIKGCSEGDFSSYSLVPGHHKYCTQSALSTYSSSTPSPTDYEDKTPELMDFALHSVVGLIPEQDTLNLMFDISDINISAEPTITLLLDTNRLLRFYNQGTAGGVSPVVTGSRAYFYDSVFLNSMFVSLGEPSSLQGYRYYAVGCVTNEEEIPTDLTDLSYCQEHLKKGSGWFTYIIDADNNPQLINLQGDDEIAAIKGTNKSQEWGELESSYFTKDENGLYNIRFNLNRDGVGMLYGFEPTDVNEEQIILEKFETNDGAHKEWYKVKLIREF